MNDLIYRKDIIDYIKEQGFYCDTEADKEYTIKIIKSFPSASLFVWTSVEEKLPETGHYLWCSDEGHMRVDFFDGKEWEFAKHYNYKVVAWMDLPEVYRGKER